MVNAAPNADPVTSSLAISRKPKVNWSSGAVAAVVRQRGMPATLWQATPSPIKALVNRKPQAPAAAKTPLTMQELLEEIRQEKP